MLESCIVFDISVSGMLFYVLYTYLFIYYYIQPVVEIVIPHFCCVLKYSLEKELKYHKNNGYLVYKLIL